MLEDYISETVEYDKILADINLRENNFSGSEQDGRDGAK